VIAQDKTRHQTVMPHEEQGRKEPFALACQGRLLCLNKILDALISSQLRHSGTNTGPERIVDLVTRCTERQLRAAKRENLDTPNNRRGFWHKLSPPEAQGHRAHWLLPFTTRSKGTSPSDRTPDQMPSTGIWLGLSSPHPAPVLYL
jgi:hypothetical protein